MSSHELTSRERVLRTLDHKEPDRVPIDIGGTQITGIHLNAYRSLRPALSLAPKEPEIHEVIQQVAVVDDEVANRLHVDVRSAGAISATPPLTDDGDYVCFHDEFGIGWRMPRSDGRYFDMFDHPLCDATSTDDVAAFAWPDPDTWDADDPVGGDLDALRQRMLDIRDVQGRAVVLESPLITGPFEMFLWLRGFEKAFLDLAVHKELAEKIMRTVVEIKICYWTRILGAVGDLVDIVVETDDLGGQQRMLISPDTYRKLIKPWHRMLFDCIHDRSGARVLLHSCGSIRPVIGDLIDAGVDILNPIQVSAANMIPKDLKQEFGKDVVFWGGGIDTQQVLNTASTQVVRDHVRQRVNELMTDGGFVFAAIHNIQDDVPPENIIAMAESVWEYGRY